MTMARVTITMPEELRHAVLNAAERAGVPFSAVVTAALGAWARGQVVDEWLADHRAEHGEFSEDELKALANEAGVPYIPPGSTSGSAAA
jgi:hypothetical protein